MYQLAVMTPPLPHGLYAYTETPWLVEMVSSMGAAADTGTPTNASAMAVTKTVRTALVAHSASFRFRDRFENWLGLRAAGEPQLPFGATGTLRAAEIPVGSGATIRSTHVGELPHRASAAFSNARTARLAAALAARSVRSRRNRA